MFKLQTILILQYTKKNDPQTFQTSVKLIASDSNFMKHLNPCIKAFWGKIKILLAKIGWLLK